MKSREFWRRVLIVIFLVASFSQWLWKPYSDLVAAFVVFGGALFLLFFWASFNNAGRSYPCEYLESGVAPFEIRKIEKRVMIVEKHDSTGEGSLRFVSFPEEPVLTSKDEGRAFTITREGKLFFLY